MDLKNIKVYQDEKDKERYVFVKDEKGKHRRKLHHVRQNVYYVRFNKKKIYLVRDYDWGVYSYVPFNYLEDESYKVDGWYDLEEKLNRLAKECEAFKKEDAYVPSAPDTGRFKATKSGDVRVEKDYRKSGGTYGVSKYFPYIFIVGTNTGIPSDKKDALLTLLLNGILQGLTINDRTPYIETVSGSAWVGRGLAI